MTVDVELSYLLIRLFFSDMDYSSERDIWCLLVSLNFIIANMWLEDVDICSFLTPLPIHDWCRLFWNHYLKPSQSTGQSSLVYNRHMELYFRTDGISVLLVLFPVIWEHYGSWLFSVTALEAQLHSNFHSVLTTNVLVLLDPWFCKVPE